MAASNTPDVVGKKFNRLLILEYKKASRTKNIPSKVLCRCICGTEKWQGYKDIKSGHTQSCGCYRKEQARLAVTTHGRRGSGIYKIWAQMLQRCNNPNDQKFKSYGARGITVSKRWHKFENFLTDMGERPIGYSLDRKNNNKGYSKHNCRWITKSEQAKNKQQTIWVTVLKKKMCLMDATKLLGLPYGTIQSRIRKGWHWKKALYEPIKH